jgi:hypothetical protein
MAGINYTQFQAFATKLISEFGMKAVLRRLTDTPTDRPCTVVIWDYNPRDQASELANPTDRKVIIAVAGLLNEPPDNERDQLVPLIGPDANVAMPFTSPVKIIAPAGIVVVYQSTVRR